jgi:hypothetical protein
MGVGKDRSHAIEYRAKVILPDAHPESSDHPYSRRQVPFSLQHLTANSDKQQWIAFL